MNQPQLRQLLTTGLEYGGARFSPLPELEGHPYGSDPRSDAMVDAIINRAEAIAAGTYRIPNYAPPGIAFTTLFNVVQDNAVNRWRQDHARSVLRFAVESLRNAGTLHPVPTPLPASALPRPEVTPRPVPTGGRRR